MKVIVASPRGFCAGVERAISIVELALEKYGPPIWVHNQIVHNGSVVKRLEKAGVVFVSSLDEVPPGGRTIFSAHGVSEAVEETAKSRALPYIDATCPLVTKVHLEAKRNEARGAQIILIGHKGHPEVVGTSGRVQQDVILVESVEDVAHVVVSDPANLSYVTQTTLSVDDTGEIISALKARFPLISGPDLKDICYATTNRQNAVKELASQVDVLLVIGAKNSSNSNRLRDLGERLGIRAYLIDSYKDICLDWFSSSFSVGITAGASAPEFLVEETISYLEGAFAGAVVTIQSGVSENVNFKIPSELLN